jgi:tellurite resistance protein TerC
MVGPWSPPFSTHRNTPINPVVWLWTGFLALVLIVLALDLGVLNRKAHVVETKEALVFTLGVICLALAFAVFVYLGYEQHWMGLGLTPDRLDGHINTGRHAAVKFITGYLIEISLSADNVFVIALIFAHLRVPAEFQHRVLFWGILGALVMRGAMIGIGAQLVARYHWILYGFGLFLVITAVRMMMHRDEEEEVPREAWVLRAMRKWLPISSRYNGSHFTAIEAGRRVLTPLAVALVLVETTDLVFAVDSIPAIFAITADPFLVFTSNVFAILGLRSLYFALAGAIRKFRYLKQSLAAILGLVGVKMLLADLLKEWLGPDFNFVLLALVMLILLAGIAASAVAERREARRSATPAAGPGD